MPAPDTDGNPRQLIRRVVVFTNSPLFSVRKAVVEIDRTCGPCEWLIVHQRQRRTLRKLARSQWLHLRRDGWRRVTGLTGAVVARVLPAREPEPRVHHPGYAWTPAGLQSRDGISVLQTPDIHAEDTIRRVTEFAPDLGLALAAPILRRQAFGIPRLGTLNLHKGAVPHYRGMPPAFWELWNDEESVGCTVHWVDDRLDTGPIEARSAVPRQPYSTVRGLQLELDELGVRLLCETVQRVGRGQIAAIPQEAGGTTYRRPTAAQQAQLARRLAAAHPPPAAPRTRRAVRSTIKGLASTLDRASRQLRAPSATVLLYHRVSDDARDNLTVGVEQFDRQMELLSRHFHLVSVADLLQWESIPRTSRPIAAVTFDDGYLDNYQHAAPLLLRHQVPATFFVTTGFIGTTRQFPHDIRRGNPPIPLMTWPQIRELRRLGFTIGAHTVNHIDCAAEPEAVVVTELRECRDHIMNELGDAPQLFAYPYGGREHMTTDRLRLVREAGYAACLSAYGGTNRDRVDQCNIRRRGVHWEFSDRAFIFTARGL